jgi:spermidine synthase
LARAHGLAPVLAAGAAFAAGFAAAAWTRSATESLGSASDAVATFGAVVCFAFALGASFGSGSTRASRPARDVGIRLLAAAALTLAAWWLLPRVPSAVAWAGGAADASPLALAFARVFLGVVVLGPAAALSGSALRSAARALPEGAKARPIVAAGVAAAAAGGLAATVLPAPAAAAQWSAAALLALAGAAATIFGRAVDAAGEDAPLPVPALVPVAFGAAAFAVAALGFLSARALVPAFGNELAGIPVGPAIFLAGLAAGAAIAVPLLRSAASSTATAASLLAGAAVWLGVSYPRVPQMSARFAGVADGAAYADAVRGAFASAWPVVVPAALLSGLALGTLAALLPEAPRARPRWLARALLGAAAGATLGLALRLPLDALGVARVMTLAAVSIAAPAAWLVAAPAPRSLPRLAGALLAFAAVVLLAVRAPAFDRRAWLVEEAVRSGAAPAVTQKSWRILDEDSATGTWSVLKRGHEKRLFVNGRLEMGTVSQIKSHGLLAHLPLLVRPGAKSVVVIGAGNGRAVGSALAHPVERLLVLVPSRAAVRAAERFVGAGPSPFADERVRVAVGDPVDLLARCGPQDVILNQVSGSWTELSERASTREFLELARRRLGESGLYAHWLPGSSLTKPGFQSLLATFAAVFPDVEIWAGQEGDVVLLGKGGRAPHDYPAVARAYQDPALAASLGDCWLGDPPTLLSQFLSPDEVVRGISRSSPVHSRGRPQLGGVEAARRRSEPTVDPVPGLAEIRGEVLRSFANAPAGPLREAVARAVQARDLERETVTAELAARGSPDGMMEVSKRYEQVLALNPRDGSVRRAAAMQRSLLGIDYSRRASFTAAYAHMLRAVEIDPTYVEGFANLGLLLMENQDFDYALAVTSQALDLAPDDDLLHHQMARIWKRRTYFNRSVPYYLKAMEINPLNVEAAMGYSDVLLSMETIPDIAGAITFLRGYLELEPDNEELHYRLEKLQRALERGAAAPPPEEAADTTPPLLRDVEEAPPAEPEPHGHEHDV